MTLRRRINAVTAALGVLALVGWGFGNNVAAEPPKRVSTTDTAGLCSNPVFIPLGPGQYGRVFESCLTALEQCGFQIRQSNRYDGRIETDRRVPATAGSTAEGGNQAVHLPARLAQRQIAELTIRPADQGGFFIDVVVRKEKQALCKKRTIDTDPLAQTWIDKGRDAATKQAIIRRVLSCLDNRLERQDPKQDAVSPARPPIDLSLPANYASAFQVEELRPQPKWLLRFGSRPLPGLRIPLGRFIHCSAVPLDREVARFIPLLLTRHTRHEVSVGPGIEIVNRLYLLEGFVCELNVDVVPFSPRVCVAWETPERLVLTIGFDLRRGRWDWSCELLL